MSRAAGSPKKKRPRKSHKSETVSEMDRDAAWKTARLAAILSTRVPLAGSVDVPGWEEGPPEAEEAMELIGHQRQDGIYMSCLRRARFLLEAAEGAGRIHAADLFEEATAYRMVDIINRFKSLRWPKLQRDVSIGKLIGDIRQEARKRLEQIEPGQMFSGNIVEKHELSEIDSIIRRREDPPRVIQFGLLLKLCERHGLLSDRLTVERRELVDPPAPRFLPPGEWSSDASQIHRILKEHYSYLLGLERPWIVTEVVEGDDLLRIALEHESLCPQCQRRCETGEESVENIKYTVLNKKAILRVVVRTLECPEHGTKPRPYDPPKLPRSHRK